MSKPQAGVVGWPIEHSKSPILHGYWLKQIGIDGDYSKVAAAPEDFEQKIRQLVSDGWRGVNVTIPHKEAALALADSVSERANAIGAANTLVFSDGQIHADNTDGYGFVENLVDRAGKAWLPSRPAVVLGAGGAARAIIHALLTAGAPEVRLLNRTRARADALADVFGSKVMVSDWDGRSDALGGAALIANTTSPLYPSSDLPCAR